MHIIIMRLKSSGQSVTSVFAAIIMFGLMAGMKAPALSQDQAPAQDSLTILLDWYVNPDHAPLLIAKQLGYFEDQNLDVELIAPADPSLPPKLVAAGKGDIAISYQPQLYLQIAAGLELARLGTLVATPLNALVVLDDGPIQTIADLKGRKVGYSVAGMESMLLGTMLAGAGLSLEDVELVNVNFALTSALASQQVDAVIGAFRNFELTLLALAGTKGRSFFVEEYGVPAYDELIYVVKQDRLQDPVMARFMDAIERATHFMLNHPEQAMAAMIDYDSKLDDTLNRRAFDDTLHRFAQSPRAFDPVRYQRFADYLTQNGLVEDLPALEIYAPFPK